MTDPVHQQLADLRNLERRMADATGSDWDLDRAVATTIAGLGAEDPVPDYSASVDACIALIGAALPKWHWHVGHGPTGIIPYASLSRDSDKEDGSHIRVEVSCPTVPLALLQVMVQAMIADIVSE